jgi:flotillin
MTQLIAQLPGVDGTTELVKGVMYGVGGIVGFFILIGIIKQFLLICKANHVLVVSGFGKTKKKIGGRTFRLPVLQDVNRMSLALMEVPISVRNAYSSGGIAMNVDAMANVKIASSPELISNAIERFLNRSEEIRQVSKETLEGHLRGVIANLTPEQVNEDRLAFADTLAQESQRDLNKLGLHLDTLKILHVSDDLGYLDATGRKAIANIVRSAEIAESDAERGAEQSEARNRGRASVTRSEADAKIAKLKNDLRKVQADLSAQVQSEEERTSAAAREARATAEQKLQQVRAELAGIRLQADEVLPAEAERIAEEYRARGRAAIIRERGAAVSQTLDLLYAAWQKAGPNAMQIAIIEDLEKILGAAAEGVQKIDVGQITVIDGGDGRTLPNYISAYPEMLNSVFDAVDKTVGISITDALSGRTPKEEKV